jgi:hypothetical protein
MSARYVSRDRAGLTARWWCNGRVHCLEQREWQPPTSKIDNVNRELAPKIRASLGVREYILAVS